MSDRVYQVTISSAERTVVSIDNFAVPQNKITFLFGESGIGKSMISKAVYGLLDPDALDIAINGRSYADHLKESRTKAIQKNSFFVFQEPSSHLNNLMTIDRQITEGSLQLAKDDSDILNHLWKDIDEQAVRTLFEIYPKPYRPSGGEKQRILLLMAFKKINVLLNSFGAEAPTYFVFDEPTGSLDDNFRNLFLHLLFTKYVQRPFTIMIITHDYSIISEVYKKYANLLDSIRFRELSRLKSGAVELHDFSPDEYLGWLQKTAFKGGAVARQEKVLEVEADFKIFNRSLCIYREREHRQKTNLVIHKGEMVYLKAPSGVGKTTLAKLVMGLFRPQKFEMQLAGTRITEKTHKSVWHKKVWGKKAGMVFQHADESLNLQATVKEVFDGLPLKSRLRSAVLKQKLGELFEGEIADAFISKKVAFLSGGQKQRLNLLRTLVMNTDLIILDEPLNGLDFLSITKVMEKLEERRRQGSALLLISHNEEIFDTILDKEHIYYLAECSVE